MILKGKTILITGGTGSFGKKFVKTVLNKYNPRKVIVFSRDEMKQYEMQTSQDFKEYENQMRYFIGDVRDELRLKRAMEDVDIVIHAAALKQVPATEYNPFEAVKTNVLGAQNVINACLDNKVKIVVALSTDKAAAPINLYGATKLTSDKLFVAANKYKGSRNIRFSVVRYGNVMASRGSVIPYFIEKAKEGIIPITHKEMTRFNITLEEGVAMVIWAIENAIGNEIFVPKIPSYNIETLAKAISPRAKLEYVGIRPGEKLHEEMITDSDSYNTIEFEKYYAILPSNIRKEKYIKHYNATEVEPGFKLNSGTNDLWLNENEIRDLIKLHVDKSFEPI